MKNGEVVGRVALSEGNHLTCKEETNTRIIESDGCQCSHKSLSYRLEMRDSYIALGYSDRQLAMNRPRR